MSRHQVEERASERALEVMRKELAAERLPDLPWDSMERDLMARLDEEPMTSHPKSLEAHVDDVPASYVRNPRSQFVRIGFVVMAAAACFALFWMSPLHSGKRVVISNASPSVATPETSNFHDPMVAPQKPTPVQAPVTSAETPAPEPPTHTIAAKDVKAAFSTCVALDKRYAGPAAAKLKGEKLMVFLEKDGGIATIRFDSPVEQQVMHCVFDKLRSGKFVGTKGPVTVQF